MKISVIIPAYNCEALVGRCIESLLNQNVAELDIIVVNDGSIDGTANVLEKYSDKIRVFTIKNSGSSAARNFGISKASGEYIMFADADDFLSDGAIERLIRVQEETDADIIKFKYRLVFPDNTVKDAYNQFGDYEVIEKKDFKTEIYPHFINGIRLNSIWSGMYRRNIIDGQSFRKDMKVAEDAVFLLGVYTKAEKVAVIPDILYNYYQTGTGLTGSAVSIMQKYICNLKFAKETVSYLKKWDMDSLITRTRVYLRPVLLTFDKLKRIKQTKS